MPGSRSKCPQYFSGVESHRSDEEVAHDAVSVERVGIDLERYRPAIDAGEEVLPAGLDQDRGVGLAAGGCEAGREHGRVDLAGLDAAHHLLRRGQRPLEGVRLGVGLGRVVTRPVDDPGAARGVLEPDPQPAELAVERQVVGLEGEQVGHARALQHLGHGVAQVGEVGEHLAAGVLRHEEQRVPIALALGQHLAAHVDGLDRAVRFSEPGEHLVDRALCGRTAEDLLVVHAPGLPVGGGLLEFQHPILLVGREAAVADQHRTVEAFRKEDDVLAALDRSHPRGQFAHPGGQGGDVAGGPIAVGGVLQIREFGAGPREHRIGVQAGAVGRFAEAVARRELAAQVRDDETQWVADRLAGLDLAQSGDRLAELAAVGGEAEHEPRPRVVERHGGQVRGMQLAQHQVGGGLLGAAHGVGGREQEVEQEQEVPPRRYRHRLVRHLAFDDLQIDHVEAGDLDRPAAVEEFEVVAGEAAQRVAAAADLHRHFDDGDRRRVAELRSVLPAAALRVGGRRKQHGARAEEGGRSSRGRREWTVAEYGVRHGLAPLVRRCGSGRAAVAPVPAQLSTLMGIELAG